MKRSLHARSGTFSAADARSGFHAESIDGHSLRDRWGHIHPRFVHPEFYDAQRMRPSRLGIDYLLPIFTDAIGPDDMEHMRQTLFDSGSLFRPYHSTNTDINKRICFLDEVRSARQANSLSAQG